MNQIRSPTTLLTKIVTKGRLIMAKRKLTPNQQLQQYIKECAERYDHWTRERKDGTVDPNWSDGVNLNLVRNHIINFKRQIRRTCDKFGLTIPSIYYRPLPPEMPADFFVTNGKNYNPQRIARILGLRGGSEDNPKPVQLTLF